MLCWSPYFPHTALSMTYGSNSPLTPSARISALNIVSDLLRKVGVSPPILPPPPTSVSAVKKGLTFIAVYASPQVLESKLAACRNFTKDQRARKAYALDNSNVLNGNTTSQTSQSLQTSYFEKAWVKAKAVLRWRCLWFRSLYWWSTKDRKLVAKRQPSSSPWCLTHVVMRIWLTVFNVADLTYVKLPCVLFPTEQRWSLSPCSVWVIAAFPTLIWVCWLFFLFMLASKLIIMRMWSPGHYLLKGGGAGISALNISYLV